VKMTPACVHDRTYIDKVLIAKTRKNPLARITACLCKVCVYYCRTYYKAVRGGGRRREEDMCYDIRRAEACVDESAHHALGPVRNPVL